MAETDSARQTEYIVTQSSRAQPDSDPTMLTFAMVQREMLALKEVIFTRLDGMDRAIVIFNDAITRTPTYTDKQISHLKALHEERFEAIAQGFTERDRLMKQSVGELKGIIETLEERTRESVLKIDHDFRERPGEIAAQIQKLRDLVWEKFDGVTQQFASIQMQFNDRDDRVRQLALDNKESLQKALDAQDKSATKQADAFTKQIDALAQLLQTETRTLNEKVNEDKGRILLIEGRTAGLATAQTTQQSVARTEHGATQNTVALVGVLAATILSVASIVIALTRH